MRRVLLDLQARRDLDDIYDYIGVEKQSPQAADRLLDALYERFLLYASLNRIARLRFPDRGGPSG
jgi:plasmid stabilization system protein ParE